MKKKQTVVLCCIFNLSWSLMRSTSYQAFHSFYKEIQSKFPLSGITKDLFLSLAESITQTLNVTSCYVCEGRNMSDHWPWEAKELNPQEPFNETTLPSLRESIWFLKTSVIGNCCISNPKGQFHPGRGLNLLATKVLQWCYSKDSVMGDTQSHRDPTSPAGYNSLK
jgi:hypothetical protein